MTPPPSRVFRSDIPDVIVQELFLAIGVKDYTDEHWWSKYNLTRSVCEKINEIIPKLVPYYFPHKHFLINRDMTVIRYIQMIRQVCKAKQFKLESKEYKDKHQNRKKVILYRIITGKKVIDPPTFTVTFE